MIRHAGHYVIEGHTDITLSLIAISLRRPFRRYYFDGCHWPPIAAELSSSWDFIDYVIDIAADY
jgi:hypothetical protein